MTEFSPLSHTARLLELMARLRTPGTGCPWDLEQNFATIAPYTIEEAYEVADAIARNDLQALEEELGDLLLQVVFHSRMAEEQGAFDFERVAQGIARKLVERHPHVFDAGSEGSTKDTAAVTETWERIKAKKRDASYESVLDDIPLALPALTRAEKIGKRVARVGFDWPGIDGVRAKLAEEISELDVAIASGNPIETADELGDVLFTLASLARHLGHDPEEALRHANRKFERRFRQVETMAGEEGRPCVERSAAELEQLWDRAKSIAG